MNHSELPPPTPRADRRTVSDEMLERFLRKHRSPNHIKKILREKRIRLRDQVAAVDLRAYDIETERLRTVVENARLADLYRHSLTEQPPSTADLRGTIYGW